MAISQKNRKGFAPIFANDNWARIDEQRHSNDDPSPPSLPPSLPFFADSMNILKEERMAALTVSWKFSKKACQTKRHESVRRAHLPSADTHTYHPNA